MSEGTKVGDSLHNQLSTATGRVLREFTGRGPTRTRTIVDDEAVVVLLWDSLTKGERVLVERDREQEVKALRATFQQEMREQLRSEVEQIIGRSVVAMLSTNSTDPDCSVEVFLLGPSKDRDRQT